MHTHELYRMLVTNLNTSKATAKDVSQIIMLLSAQLPNSDTVTRDAYHAFATKVEAMGHDSLPKLNCGDLNSRARRPRPDAEEFLCESPQSEDEVADVVFNKVRGSQKDNLYHLDKHNTNVLCKFHEYEPPTQDDFIRMKVVTIIKELFYQHQAGSFKITHRPDGDSLVEIVSPFTLEAFIPVRVHVV